PPCEDRFSAYPVPRRRPLFGLRRLSPEWRDALLYGCSALFAGVTALAVGIPLYRQWGQMAVGPYLAAAGVTALAGWRSTVADRRTGEAGRPGRGDASEAARPSRSGVRWRKSARVVAFF